MPLIRLAVFVASLLASERAHAQQTELSRVVDSLASAAYARGDVAGFTVAVPRSEATGRMMPRSSSRRRTPAW